MPANPAAGVKLPKLCQTEQLFPEPEQVDQVAAPVPGTHEAPSSRSLPTEVSDGVRRSPLRAF